MGIPARYGALGLVLLVVLGCGGDGKLPHVQGRVYYRGQPLPGGTIVFTPDPERGGSGALAFSEIGPDGHYVLHTGPEAGAVPGWHRVTVAPPAVAVPAPAGTATPIVPAWPLPRKYCHPDHSGQSHEVKPGQSNTLDIHLD